MKSVLALEDYESVPAMSVLKAAGFHNSTRLNPKPELSPPKMADTNGCQNFRLGAILLTGC